jgi:hypothetical protein
VIDMYIAMGSLIVATILGILLTIHNYKALKAIKPQRLAARRAFKRRKNAELKKYLDGLKDKKD